MQSEALKKAKRVYQHKLKTYCLQFYGTDKKLEEWLFSQPNVQGYIKGLIRKDMDAAEHK